MQKTRKLIMVVGGLILSHAALAKDMSKKDTEYLQKAVEGTISEVKMGEMAQKQAADERVKQFGKRMVDDHGKDLQNIKQLASQKHVTLPDAPDRAQSRESDKLAKLSGADFDREYVKYEMKDHKDDVKESAKAMKEATDPDVKKFASAEHQTVVAHKKEIDAIHARLGK